MITAWDIYWVMQLDAIGAVVSFIAISLCLITAIAFVLGGINKYEASEWPSISEGKKELGLARQAYAKRMLLPAATLLLLSALTPSTKTAAAMLIIPKIANSEVIRREADDLYTIAKEAMRNLAKPDSSEEAKK